MRNFTTFLFNWVKEQTKETRKLFKDNWTNSYRKIVHKIIREKAQDAEYFIFHLKNTFNHMTGNHQLCDDFYCDDKRKLQF